MGQQSEAVPVTNHDGAGGVQSALSMLADEMHGQWELIRKDGSVMRTGSFDRGRQVGTWRTFDRTGRLVKETVFPDDPDQRPA